MANEKDRLRELVNNDYREARKKTGSMPDSYLRLIRSEEELGKWFLKAYQNEISLDELREKGSLLEENLGDFDESDMLLNDSLAFLYELHDGGVKIMVAKNPDIIKRYAQALLGESKKEYCYRPHKGIELTITYEKIK